MDDGNRTAQLLAEIRDLLAGRESMYKEHIADTERLYKEQFADAKRRALLARPLQWGSLFAIVYFAVSLAL